MIEDIYTFDKCKRCGKYLPLKNDKCINCQGLAKNPFPPGFWDDIFRKKK